MWRECLKEASRCMIQKGADVTVDHRPNPAATQALTYCLSGLMRATATAKARGEVADILLVNRLQQHRPGFRPNLVLQGRQPSRPELSTPFGDQTANDRLRTVRSVDEFLVYGLQVCLSVVLVRTPCDPVSARGAVRVEAPKRVCQQRHIQVVGERGTRHVGIRTCLSCEPFQSLRDGHRARSPLPHRGVPGMSRRGSAMTPGFTFAAPGPTDGGGSLASRPRGLPRRRLLRLAVPRSMLVCACRGTHGYPRSSDPLRLPPALPEFLRVPACPSVPVVPALWVDGSTRRSGGPFRGGALIARWTPRRALGSALFRDV